MDRLRAMSIFAEAVESGSFSAAGRQLGIPLPTVSRTIAELETHLKARLLNRTTRQLTLTDAGRSYLASCKRILEQVEEAERGAAGEYSIPKGELVVTAPLAFGRVHVLPVICEFLGAYPDIDIHLSLSDRVVHLVEDHVDVAVRIGALPDSSMIATRAGFIRHIVCASADYLKRNGMPREPVDLAAHACITFEGLRYPNAWTFGQQNHPIEVPIHSRLTVNTAEAAVDAAMAGVGITRVLSYQAATLVRAGALKIILEKFEPEPLPVHLVYGAQGLVPLKLRAFLDFALPRLKDSLASRAALTPPD
ncbi:MAG: LysR family transcriptional regulator [Bradyrhizobiaceae bacterium]|nr:MAG: LysR family transcriptional regulator [Bradyrhizobiaceae bacterium]